MYRYLVRLLDEHLDLYNEYIVPVYKKIEAEVPMRIGEMLSIDGNTYEIKVVGYSIGHKSIVNTITAVKSNKDN